MKMKTKLRVPANVEDVSHGRLRIEIGQLYCLLHGGIDYPSSFSNHLLQFQLRFEGEALPTILRASNTERALLYPNQGTYEVVVPARDIIAYLERIHQLKVLIQDSSKRKIVGHILLPLAQYLNREIDSGKYTHSFIYLDERLKVFKESHGKEEVGELQVRVEGSATVGRPSASSGIADFDQRIANSMAAQKPELKYAREKHAGTDAHEGKGVGQPALSEYGAKPQTFKARAQVDRNASRNGEEEETGRKVEREEVEYNRDLEDIFSKAEKLRMEMETSLHAPTISRKPLEPQYDDLELLEDSLLSDLDKVVQEHKDETHPIKEESKNGGTDIKQVRKMAVSLLGVSMKSEETLRRLKGHKLYIFIRFPIAQRGSSAIQEEEMKVQFNLSSVDKNQLKAGEGTKIVEMNRVHECGMSVTDENFAALVNSQVSIELLAEVENGCKVFGKGEMSFQKVVLAPSYTLDTLMKITHVVPQQDGVEEATKSRKKEAKKKGKAVGKSTHKIALSHLQRIGSIDHIADLRLRIALLSEQADRRVEEMKAQPQPQQPSLAGLLVLVKIERARDVILRKYEGDHVPVFRNLYVKYKSFPAGEAVATGVSWESAASVFNHHMQFPLFLTEEVIARTLNAILIFELWDKNGLNKTQDELVGLAKVPLRPLFESLKSQVVPNAFTAHHILANAYPFILADEFVAVISPRLGQSVGWIKVLVAVGTPSQMLKLNQRDESARPKQYALFADARMDSERQNTIEGGDTKRREELGSVAALVSPKTEGHPAEKKDDAINIVEEQKECSKPPEPQDPEDERVEEMQREAEHEVHKVAPTEEPRAKESEPQPGEERKLPEGEGRASIEEINEIAMWLNQPKHPAENEDLVKIYHDYEELHEDTREVMRTKGTPTKPEHCIPPLKIATPTKDTPAQTEEVEVVSAHKEEDYKTAFIKHSFTIMDTIEIVNIPVIERFVTTTENKVLNMYLKATLPFDRAPVESESVRKLNSQTYQVTMGCRYSIVLPQDKQGEMLRSVSESMHDALMELYAIDPRKVEPILLGTAELPSEDVQMLMSEETKGKPVERVVFLYGSTAVEREGLIIGKLKLGLKYELEQIAEPYELEAPPVWQQERVASREIPLYSRLSVRIHKIDGIGGRDKGIATTRTFSGSFLPPRDQLNLSVYYCPLGEIVLESQDQEEDNKRREYITDTLCSTAEPKFNARWVIDFTVSDRVLRNMEHGLATFKVLHAGAQASGAFGTFGKSDHKMEGMTEVVGTARVPLMKLLSTHSGIINEPFEIKDRYNHHFGYLHISMNLLDASLEFVPESPSKVLLEESKRGLGNSGLVESRENSLGTRKVEPLAQVDPIAVLEVTIESGLRLKNPLDENKPPNACATIEYALCTGHLETNTSPRSCYPSWNETFSIQVPMSEENRQAVCREKMRVYVYHREMLREQETKLLIGVCAVDTTILALVDNMDLIEGYYKLTRSGGEEDEESVGEETGIVKLRVETPHNVRQMVTGADPRPVVREYSSPRFGGGHTASLKDVYNTLRQIRGGEKDTEEELKTPPRTLQSPHPAEPEEMGGAPQVEERQSPLAEEYSLRLQRIEEELSVEESEELIRRHLRNLEELDRINEQLKIGKSFTLQAPLVGARGDERELGADSVNGPMTLENARMTAPGIAGYAEQSLREASNVFDKNLMNLRNTMEATIPEEHAIRPEDRAEYEESKKLHASIDRKRLLSTPHKKPAVPQRVSSSGKKVTGTEMQERELQRISSIMRSSPASAKKYHEYSSDSDQLRDAND